MVIIFCGEDLSTARKNFICYKNELGEKGYDCKNILSDEIESLPKWLSSTNSLFATKIAFFIERSLNTKKNRDIIKLYEFDPNITILCFEELPEKELKKYFPKAKFIVSKLPESIFNLLDNIYPYNAKKTTEILKNIINSDNEMKIFYLIKQRIKDLILFKIEPSLFKDKQQWQILRLNQQSKKFSTNTLLNFYESLYKIERNIKTNSTPLTLVNMIEILFAKYLSE